MINWIQLLFKLCFLDVLFTEFPTTCTYGPFARLKKPFSLSLSIVNEVDRLRHQLLMV